MSKSVYSINSVSRKERLAFAFAGGGQNFCYALVTSYLMYFYINVFHIDAEIVGLMLLIMGFWDVVNNPIAGVIIDKTRSKKGKMIPYLRYLMPPLAVFTALLFSGPKILGNSSPFKVIYMVVTYFCWEVCYTFTDVAYWGLSSVISADDKERTKILTLTNVIINIAAAIPQVLVPVFLDVAQLPESRISLSDMFFVMGISGGIIGVGLFSLSGVFVKEKIRQSNDTPSIKESLLQLLNNPVLRIVIISNLIYSLSGVGIVFSTYYFIDVLGYASLSVISQIPFAVFGFVSYSLISPVKKRLNNKQIMILLFVILGTVQFVIYLIGMNNYENVKVMLPLIMIYQTISGLFSAFSGVIPNELLCEATDYCEWKTGKRNEGVSFSLKITTTKINGTITQSVAAMLLSAIGYAASSATGQTSDVKSKLWLMFYLVPSIITLTCAVPYFFYPLTAEKKQEMYFQLKESRKK